ncbi:MAG TPA: DUF4142 domain-containing protein, partial [Gemmatimonadaceae bacterium]|nr:DUF4142 domain-containing protein [Gemmatimonadaceae bacterium]
MLRKQYRLGLAAGAVIAIAACSGGDDGAADTGAAMTADTGAVAMGDTGMGAATPAAGPGATAMSDANIVYALDNINMLDSAAGSIASTKGTSSEVRDYGKMMMRDHHTLRQQGQDLAKKLGVTP